MKATTKILKKIRQAGYTAYIVGGYVRDILMGRVPSDIDIVTDALPEQVLGLFDRTLAVGQSFGVVIVIEDGTEFEVATFRRDLNCDGRRCEVEYASVEEDAARRDFTVNALYLDPITGKVLDFHGGVEDINRKVIRFIGDSEGRIREDRLRMLRAIRFAGKLGFKIEPESFEAIKRNAHTLLKTVSWERIQKELKGILQYGTLDLLDASGLMEVILPEITALKGIKQCPKYHPEGDVFTHTMQVVAALPEDADFGLRLAALLHDVGKKDTFVVRNGRPTFFDHEHIGAGIAKAICERLRLDRATIRRVVWLIDNHMRVAKLPEMRRGKALRLLHHEFGKDLLELHKADSLGSDGDLSAYEYGLKLLVEEPEPRPERFITGRDLIDRGLKPGPVFRVILEEMYTRQLDGTITSRKEALKVLPDVINSNL